MSASNIPSACRIANIALNDAMILPYDATPSRMEFLERTSGGVRLTHQRTADQLAPPCIANRNGALTFTSSTLRPTNLSRALALRVVLASRALATSSMRP